MEAIKQLGVSYGRLGLSTDPELIHRRGEGVAAASLKLEKTLLASLVAAAFGVGTSDDRFAFLSDFNGDPTFDVQPGDREALLLAGSVAQHAIEDGSDVAPTLALAIVTCACGGLREPPMNDQLVTIARTALAVQQGRVSQAPADRSYVGQPKTMQDSITAVSTTPNPYNAPQTATAVAALQAVGAYAETVAKAAAESDQQLLNHVRTLEQEMRVYWWVTGGWSDDAKKPFRDLPLPLAAVCAGKELAAKHSNPLGLFAAPALIDLVLERGRSAALGDVSFELAIEMSNQGWRRSGFGAASASAAATLMPASAAMGLAAASDDAEDWKPRFARLTGLKSDAALPAAELAIQVYRERLLSRALA